MKKAFLSLMVIFFLFDAGQAIAASDSPQPQSLPTSPLHVLTSKGIYDYNVELAKSFKEHSIGLMYRREMPQNHGMIFLNKHLRVNSFWMKNTYIPLDIIFLDSFGRVINIAHDATPLSLEPITAERPAKAVLELNAGQAKLMGLMAGDKIFHHIFNNMDDMAIMSEN